MKPPANPGVCRECIILAAHLKTKNEATPGQLTDQCHLCDCGLMEL